MSRRELLSSVGNDHGTAVDGPADKLDAFNVSWSELQLKAYDSKPLSSSDGSSLEILDVITKNFKTLQIHVSDMERTTSSTTSNSSLIARWNEILSSESSVPAASLSSSRVLKPSLQSLRHPTSTPIASGLAPILPCNDSTMSVSESVRSADPNPLPEFIEPAYKFFVANIFNPYPTSDEKQAIVDKTSKTSVTFTSISNWFTDARRRCGWADILKRRCNGNRDEMVDLAKRVFVRPDPCNPVDSRIVAEFMEMKENVESMYERKTRPSAWIEDLEDLDELVNPIPEEDRISARKHETEEEHEACRREKDMLNEQREFEQQKRKMQAETLCKADNVTKRMQREEEEREKQSKIQRISSFSSLFDVAEDEEVVPETPKLVAGGKRKDFHEDGGFDGIRNISPSSSLSSFSFVSDSSDNAVPSLSWSDSGDEERPYKRIKSSSDIPESLAPALEIPASFNYNFNFDQSMGLADIATPRNDIFDFSLNPTETIVANPSTPSRGQKRTHEPDESIPTPRSKRAKSVVIPMYSQVAPAMPVPSSLFNATPMLPGRRRSSYIPLDIETVLGLNNSNPEPVQMALPDASMPLEVGVYDWSNAGMAPFDISTAIDETPPGDFSQLLQMFQEQQQSPQAIDSQIDSSEERQQEQQLQLDLSNYNFSSSCLQQSNTLATGMLESHSLDLTGLMTGLMSAEAFNDMGFEYQESIPCTPEELSRSPSGSPAWTTSVLEISPSELMTTVDLAEKASREKKRRELEEKKAALERELAHIAEMEREFADG